MIPSLTWYDLLLAFSLIEPTAPNSGLFLPALHAEMAGVFRATLCTEPGGPNHFFLLFPTV